MLFCVLHYFSFLICQDLIGAHLTLSTRSDPNLTLTLPTPTVWHKQEGVPRGQAYLKLVAGTYSPVASAVNLRELGEELLARLPTPTTTRTAAYRREGATLYPIFSCWDQYAPDHCSDFFFNHEFFYTTWTKTRFEASHPGTVVVILVW